MSQTNIELIKTDVTSLKIYKTFLLAGIGSQLHVYDLNNNVLLRKDTLFDGLRIHGIEVNLTGSHVLLNAEHELLLLKTCFDLKLINLKDKFLSIERRIPFNDWILASKWLQYNNFVIVTMHNNVEFYNNETLMIAQNTCDTKCILYCACVCFDTVRDTVVLSGTVFSEILVWRPFYSGEVFYRLHGHEGVLFSITYFGSHILSTSDDRSVTLWEIDAKLQDLHQRNLKILIKNKMHGHTARVFCGKVLNNYILSAGEDGRVNIWDFDANLIKTFNVHHGGSVWSLEYDEINNLIISGGSDSSITRLPLKDNWQTVKIHITENETPKKLIILQNSDVIVITESGLLMHYNKAKNIIVNVGVYKEFKSYVLLEVSVCRTKFVLAGLHGDILVFGLYNNELKEDFRYCIANKKRIFAIHWLTCQHLLTCGPDGVLYLWKLQTPSKKLLLNNSLLLIDKYVLPTSKERWSTSACRIPKLGIVVGDRKGNLHYFSFSSTDTMPTHTIKRAHSHLGITKLYWDANKKLLTSFGRNSTIRNYHITSKIIPITSDVLPFAWLGLKLGNNSQISKININTSTDNVILGFSGNEMLLFDYNKRLELFKTDCGGGHRSWDYFDDTFVYIRDKAVNCLQTSRPIELTSSIHSTEMNTMKCLKFSDKIMFISGGEDTTLRFSSCDLSLNTNQVKEDNKRFINKATIKSHLSSIRCMHIIKKFEVNSYECGYELVTAGGRGQIIYWLLKLDSNNEFLFCKQLHSFYEQENEEIRVMDLTSIEIDDKKYLLAACSDGSVKIYRIENYRLELYTVLTYKLRCILKLFTFTIVNQQKTSAIKENILVTMATDGFVSFWRLNTVFNLNKPEKTTEKPLFSYKTHLSGVNAFDFKVMNDLILILTGGDDNQINLVLYQCLISDPGHKDNVNINVLYHYKDVDSHCAQITGVYLSDKYFFTASLDQKLLIFEYKVKQDLEVKFKLCHNSVISDIKGINVFNSDGNDKDNEFDVILYGLGIELLTIKV